MNRAPEELRHGSFDTQNLFGNRQPGIENVNDERVARKIGTHGARQQTDDVGEEDARSSFRQAQSW
jgi:hypothetical protein